MAFADKITDSSPAPENSEQKSQSQSQSPVARRRFKGPRFSRRRWIVLAVIALCVAAVAFPFVWQSWVNWRYADRIVVAENAPTERVAIVFGARIYSSQRLSAMLRDRVDTGVDLYHAGKVQKLIMSGDNSSDNYNEPGAMMNYAIGRGVPAADIQPDYGGRRTYDTCYRARHIFQVESAILVTQAFHLPRALFLCDTLGTDVTGVIADRRPYDPRSIAWSETREVPALIAALLDAVRRAPPPILGEPLPLK
ncbi:MAG: ElyC/SanA/YdcF family protein [Litorilinea sp.]